MPTMVVEDLKGSPMESFARFRSSNFELHELENGNHSIESFPVFRTGTFRDSMGEQRSWTREHLAQMVSNFNMLRDGGLFTDAPVRDGHPGFLGGGAVGSGPGRVVGYVTDLRVGDANADGETLLIADFEFTEKDAVEKYQSGTFRARSSEIGMYETNDEQLHWPVFLGFAFVDIGAVEKLYGKMTSSNHYTLSEDSNMPPSDNAGDGTIDLTNENEGAAGSTEGAAGDAEATEETEVTAGVTAEHAAPATTGNFTFRVGGEPTTDFGQVQQHIDQLESIQGEMIESSRNEFVTGLAERNVIPATQVDAMQTLVRDMSPDQYNQFTEMYASTPPNALFANHDGGVTNEDGTEGTTSSSESDEMEILKERVAYARKSGLDEEAIKKMASYKKLQELNAAAASAN